MTTLRDKLEKFEPKAASELDEKFLNLAESFLYGGYISVSYNNKEQYRIYLRTIEFYCHHEGKDASMPKDPIVYHRNGRYVEGEVPYFPLMAFHAHASGYDITFEKKDLQLRSSALIRAYEVYDVEQGSFLTYNRSSKKFVTCENKKERLNPQSTYLYYFLNGFIYGSEGNSVEWKDFKEDVWKNVQQKEIEAKLRKNVPLYDNKGEKIPGTKDEREWSFTRTEDLPF